MRPRNKFPLYDLSKIEPALYGIQQDEWGQVGYKVARILAGQEAQNPNLTREKIKALRGLVSMTENNIKMKTGLTG